MRKIRIGNDIAVQWSLVAKGTGEPFVVEGKDIRLSLKSIFAKTAINEFDVAGNTISWTFKGAEQKQVGIYSLEVSLLDEQGVMITTDVCDFVELVACSCEIGGMDATGVHTESIELVSDVDVAAGIDLSAYLTKTEAQTTYQPQEKGKGLSTNDYTNAEKNKLDGLQNYDDTKIRQGLTELSAEVEEISNRTNNIEFEANAQSDDSIVIETNDGKEVAKILAESSEGGIEEQRWESNDGKEVYASVGKYGLKAKITIDIPSIEIPQVYEPTDDLVDVGYSSPIGRNNVKRADWSAENKYTYYEFLAHYYDGYLGNTEGYSVRKRSLGTDSSKSGYELFEYDFKPLNYRKVVMISAGMNTCETGAIWGLATFVKALMTSEEEGFKFLRENVRFKILPFICPSSFDQETLRYPNSNGVRINKNFDWDRVWYEVTDSTKGEYPDSEAESRILKAWINENAWKADLYMDCHQDPDKNTSQVNDLTIVMCSDTQTRLNIEKCFPSLIEFYRNKGYIASGVTPKTSAWVEPGYSYPKTRYAKDVCGIPSIMIEQYCSSTMFGSDGNTINDIYGIKNYALMLRLYTFSILAKGAESIKGADLSTICLMNK